MATKKLIVSNDPIPVVFQAYLNLYPDKLPDLIQLTWSEELMKKGWGETIFYWDGKVIIQINNKLPLESYPEVMIHELAHVAVGITDDPHGPEWKNAFTAIYSEFERLIEWKKGVEKVELKVSFAGEEVLGDD